MAIYTNTRNLELARLAQLDAEALAVSRHALRLGGTPYTLNDPPFLNDPQFVGATQIAQEALEVEIMLREQPQGQLSPSLE